ncbi:hypothetical protein UPYG_G00046850 [Umbra pygmaea]|uniref:Microtubule-associated tumor suppressor 1 n=1 Tax=Umbra pygmaea TaxID=75934 RepID=A0ABD0YF50_UMBPY
MSVSVPAVGLNGSGMRLRLLCNGDQNGNAFPVTSSSSSSPDSLRSLSSLSSGESPRDVHMECPTATDSKLDATSPAQECFPEPNDNSASVYLDADEDTWNDNLMLSDRRCDVSSMASSCGERRDSTPDSDATETPEDEDDEEGSFLSVSSDVAIPRNSMGESASDSARLPDLCEGLGGSKSPNARSTAELQELQNMGSCLLGLLDVEVHQVGVDMNEETGPLDVLSQEKEAYTSAGLEQRCKGVELSLFIVPPSPIKGAQVLSPASHKTKETTGGTRVKPNVTKTVTTTSTSGKADIKRFPKPNLKNVRSKIMSRPASAPRTTNQMQGKAALTNEKKAQDGLVRQRSSLGQNKVATLKPGHRPIQNVEPRVSNQSQKRRRGTVANGIRSVSSSSLGSEMTVDGSQRTPGEASKNVHVPNGVTKVPAGEETPAKQRSCGNKVSSKLGPPSSPARQITLSEGPGGRAGFQPGLLDDQNAGGSSPPRGRLTQPVGIPKPRVTDRTSGIAAPTVVTSNPKQSVNPGLGAARPNATTAASKLPVKNLPTSLSCSSLGSAAADTNGAPPSPSKVSPQEVVVGGGCKPEERPSRPATFSGTQSSAKSPGTTTGRTLGFRSRAPSLPGRSTTTGLKTPAVTGIVAAKPAQTPLLRTGSARLNRPTSAAAVDKTKPRAGAPPVGRTASQTVSSAQAGGPNQPDLVPVVPLPAPQHSVSASEEGKPRAQREGKTQCVKQLRRLVELGNRRIEALATVVQHLFNEREDGLKLKKGLSSELTKLRHELVSSSQCCERLQKEKEEVRVSLEEAVRRLQGEHQAELTGLEERLRAFYQAEWDKVHQAYQEEADKCRAHMEQQLEEMRSRQASLRTEQEASHAQQMEALKLTYDASVQELKTTQKQDLENLDNKRKETEATLNEKIKELTLENEVLSEKLGAEEERRRVLAEKNQKDSHVVYLQQELDSLKVVLEIKTTQLHQQDKKLMQMDKLVETNVKLEERLNKVLQENEDYRARMDKHTALSRQLSSEQALLQQTLQKESKVNKRLSMENEELLWKLHNGDLASPRRLSPSSPFHSPRNSASFSSSPAPLSPTR